jgi:hypothetical protein
MKKGVEIVPEENYRLLNEEQQPSGQPSKVKSQMQEFGSKALN